MSRDTVEVPAAGLGGVHADGVTLFAALQPVHVTVTTAGSSVAWGAVISGLIGALGAIIGVLITQRATRRQKLEDRRAARNVEQRDAIAELIDAAEQWMPRAQILSNRLLSATNETLRGLFEEPEAEAAETALQRLRSALVQCRLVVTDGQTRPVVLQIDAELRKADQVNTELVNVTLTQRQPDGPRPLDWPGAIQRVRDYYRGVDDLAQQLQDVALTRLT